MFSDADVSFFESKIRPVLVQHCYECHSAEAAAGNKLKGGLLLDSRAGVMAGGDSGPAAEPGKVDGSLLLEALRYESFEMPPSGPLPSAVIADFERWIQRGLPDPRQPTPGTVESNTPRDPLAGRDHWAYQPLSHSTPTEPPNTTPPIATPVALPNATAVTQSLRDASSPRPDPDDASQHDNASVRSPIDRFIDARLRQHRLRPNPEASLTVLVRRLYFDLTGLPPTSAQLDAFLRDRSPDAYERLVDQLLASPEFGQRWGRHWLDVARFAESITLRGSLMPDTWRYRDYVIEHFNADRSLGQFVREQIAGDLLPAATWQDRRRQLIATIFLTLGNNNLEDQDKLKLRMDVVDEQLQVIGRGFLAQTLGCARCHDHKFDPIPTRDYYALAGILQNTRTLIDANVSEWITASLPVDPDRTAAIERHRQAVGTLERQIRESEAELAKLQGSLNTLDGIVVDDDDAKLEGAWVASSSVSGYIGRGYRHDQNTGDGTRKAWFAPELPEDGDYEIRIAYTSGTNRSAAVPVTVVSQDGSQVVPVNQRQTPPILGRFVSLGVFSLLRGQQHGVAITNDGTKGHVIIDAVQFLPTIRSESHSDSALAETEARRVRAQELQSEIEQQQAELKALRSQAPPQPQIASVRESETVEVAHVHIRGDVHHRGAEVPRGFLQVLAPDSPVEFPSGESGRRELADWLADPANPLPWRVYANRLWHWLFGTGLVRTTDNFGATGEAPSHPELLDYLAIRLQQGDGSTKQLVREIVLSATYRRSSDGNAEWQEGAERIDPENRLLWRANRRRLEAECLLDAMLLVSGRLQPQLGGQTLQSGTRTDYDYDHGVLGRRAVYWPVLRNSLPRIFEVFDFANPSMVVGTRDRSSTPPQSLFMMNNPLVLQLAEQTAHRALADAGSSDTERIDWLYRNLLGRAATAAERQAICDFLAENPRDGASSEAGQGASAADPRLAAWSQVVQTLFASLDFRYVE